MATNQDWDDVNGFTQTARQERIAERVLQSDFVSAKDLAESFAVSLMTIHRDLDDRGPEALQRPDVRPLAAGHPRGGMAAQSSRRTESRLGEQRLR